MSIKKIIIWYETSVKCLVRSPSQFLLQLGSYCNKSDSLLFIYRTHNIIIILIYMDDVLIAGNNNQSIVSLFVQLDHEFAIKDLDPLHYFLGVEIKALFSNYF